MEMQGEIVRRDAPLAIIILGMHRSGTSLAAGLMQRLGVDFGTNMMPANETNPRGFYEPLHIVALHDEIFDVLKTSWDDPRPLPAGWENGEAVAACRRKLTAIVKKDYAGKALWGIKDPRLSRLFPLWEKMLRNLGARIKVVVVYRDPREVAASLYDRDDMDYRHALGLWSNYLLAAERATRGHSRAFVDGNALVRDWRAETEALARHLGLELAFGDPKAVADADRFASPDLFHHVAPQIAAEKTPEAREAEALYDAFRRSGIEGPAAQTLERLAPGGAGKAAGPVAIRRYLEHQVAFLRQMRRDLTDALHSERRVLEDERRTADELRRRVGQTEAALHEQEGIRQDLERRLEAAEVQGYRLEAAEAQLRLLERERADNRETLAAMRKHMVDLHALLLRREQRFDKLVHLPHFLVRRPRDLALKLTGKVGRAVLRHLPVSEKSKLRLKHRTFSLFPSLFAHTDALRVWAHGLPLSEYLRLRVSRLRSRRHFDPLFYRAANPGLSVMSDDDLRRHYEEHGIRDGKPGSAYQFFRKLGVSPRNIPRNFSYLDYFDFSDDLAPMRERGAIYAIEHYLLHGWREKRIYNSRQSFVTGRSRRFSGDRRLVRARGNLRLKRAERLAVMVHVYYPELWGALSPVIRNCGAVEHDLFVNLVDSTWTHDCIDEIRAQFPAARVQISENRGRDIGGYLSLMRGMTLANYDVALLLHTKKSPHVSAAYSAKWRDALLAPLAGTAAQLENNLAHFRTDRSIGVIGAAACRLTDVGRNAEQIDWLAGKLGMAFDPGALEYVSGTMQLIRTDILEALARGIGPEDMVNGDAIGLDGHLDGQLAHAVERIFCPLAHSMGYKVLWQIPDVGDEGAAA